MDPKQLVYDPHADEFYWPPRSPIDTTFYVKGALTDVAPPPASDAESAGMPVIETLISMATWTFAFSRVTSPQAFGDDVRASLTQLCRNLLDTVVTPVLPLAPDVRIWTQSELRKLGLVQETLCCRGDRRIEGHGAQPLGSPVAVRDLPLWHNRDALWDLVTSVPEMYFALDPKYQTRRLRLHAVRHNPRAIVLFPQTRELVVAALSTRNPCGYSSAHFIREMTPELATLAVQTDPYALLDLPRALITPELCDMATRAAPAAFRGVPNEYCTEAMCRRLLNNFNTDAENLRYIPERFHDRVFTEENLLRAVGESAWVPYYVPAKYLTVNIYQLACRRGFSLCKVPDHLRPAVAAALGRQYTDGDA
tara:strand:- start:898 stop:1992 length:1095 start_codon:yes stop_codon:yes gene_type:complete